MLGDIFCRIKIVIKMQNLHRPGIEPGPPAWQASILPLNQRCITASNGAYDAMFIILLQLIVVFFNNPSLKGPMHSVWILA